MYRVDRTDPSKTPIMVDMSTTKQQLGLTWVGQYYSRYGEIQSENLLKLLENFASDTQPNVNDDSGSVLRNVQGQLWYHTADTGTDLSKSLKVYNNNNSVGTDGWKRLETMISNTEPSVHTEGEWWYEPSKNTLRISRSTRWEKLTVDVALDSERLGGKTADQYVRSDVNDTVYGVLRTNVLMPDRDREFDLGRSGNRWLTAYIDVLDTNYAHSIVPEYNDFYDLGTYANKWREGHFTFLNSTGFTSVRPIVTNQHSLGSSSKWWLNANIRNIYADFMTTIKPMSSTDTMGTDTTPWAAGYFNLLDAQRTKSLIPFDLTSSDSYDLGSLSSKWSNIYVDIIRDTKTESLRPNQNNVYDLGSNALKYRSLYVENVASNVKFQGDINFDIIQNGYSKGITWRGLNDQHSIRVEEVDNLQSTRLVIESGNNTEDYTVFRVDGDDLAYLKKSQLEVVGGTLRTKGRLEVEDTTTSTGCRMEYNDTNETLEFIFY